MDCDKMIRPSANEKGAALVVALLSLALMMTLVMGISLTAISELGVTNTYANQTQAFQAAEAGLYHALNLTRNYTGNSPTNTGFTSLLAERDNNGTFNTNRYTGNNPFTNAAKFAAGSVMINDDDATGHWLRSANVDGAGNQIP